MNSADFVFGGFFQTLSRGKVSQFWYCCIYQMACMQINNETEHNHFTIWYWFLSRGTSLIGKRGRDFSRKKGFTRILDGFFLKTKGFLPKLYEIFWEWNAPRFLSHTTLNSFLWLRPKTKLFRNHSTVVSRERTCKLQLSRHCKLFWQCFALKSAKSAEFIFHLMPKWIPRISYLADFFVRPRRPRSLRNSPGQQELANFAF